MATAIKRILLIVIGLSVIAAIVWAFLPEPVAVDMAEVTVGPMRVTVDEEGRTRIRERYTISSPLTGRLRRIQLDPGDPVVAGETIVAIIEPTDPQLLDARARAEALARVRAAEAAVQQAEARGERVRASLDHAENELARVREAHLQGAATQQELDDAETTFRSANEEYRAAEFAQEIANYELEIARSALLHAQPDSEALEPGEQFRFPLRAPITGRVLRVFQESVNIVTPGTPLLEVGDPTDLEIVVDVLSTDGVKIDPGDEVVIDRWGGDQPLAGVVRLIEPSAFTKISALGVEEQRVNVIVDFISPVEERPSLGDGFRVEASIVLWEENDVVQVPSSALFRRGDQWLTFIVREGQAVMTPVHVARDNGIATQVLSGLQPGDRVIVHPSDAIADGLQVVEREPL